MDRRDILHGAATLAGWGLCSAGCSAGARAAGPARPRPRPAVRLGLAQGPGRDLATPAVRRPGRPAATAARGADLGPVRGAALSPRHALWADTDQPVPGPVLPSRQLLPHAVRIFVVARARRGRSTTTPACSTTARPVRPALAARSGLRRLAAPLPHQLPPGRRRLPRRLLLPRHRRRQPVRHVLPWPRGRHRPRPARGVPALHPLLAGPAAADRHDAHRLRAARERERHRRLPLRHLARRRHDDGGHRPALPAQADRAPRHRAHDQHVLVRRERAPRHRRMARGDPRFGRARRCGAATASGSGGR